MYIEQGISAVFDFTLDSRMLADFLFVKSENESAEIDACVWLFHVWVKKRSPAEVAAFNRSMTRWIPPSCLYCRYEATTHSQLA